jgi:pilus assembly protein CpaC
MFQRELTNGLDRLPFLGDLPVLGTLFRSSRYQRGETELVILITPYIVRPTEARDAAIPNDQVPGGATDAATLAVGHGAGFIVN